ncbi:MAG: TlpA family protein disulfide reductase [Calditrichaeota bacterium]|nr:MAG: TlpA family protein disulfide reductase [Calditrichota bacterium]
MRVQLLSVIGALLLASAVARAGTIPDFRLQDLDRREQSFNNLKGERFTVIDFWATWCKPCLRAIPALNALQNDFAARGIRVIGINTDSPRNSAKVKPFVRINKIAYTVLRDPNGVVTGKLNVKAFPTLFIINARNEIVYTHIGFKSGDERLLREKLTSFLEAAGE